MPEKREGGSTKAEIIRVATRMFLERDYSLTSARAITVKPICTHESGTLTYTNNGNGHTYTRSCCNITVTEGHTYTDCVCICGGDDHNYDNGFCVKCDAYEPAVLKNGFYEIGNAGQLYWFAQQVNGGNTAIHGELTAMAFLARAAYCYGNSAALYDSI